MSPPLLTFECFIPDAPWQRGFEPHYETVYAYTKGAAKADYWRSVREAWQDIPFTAVRARRSRSARRDPNLDRVAAYRGLPALAPGVTRVRVFGRLATVIGANASANIDVIYDDGRKISVHPADLEILA